MLLHHSLCTDEETANVVLTKTYNFKFLTSD